MACLTACGGSSGTDAGDGGGADAPHDAPAADLAGDAPPCRDADSDGHAAMSCGGDDCDDADPNRYPGNTELCDSVDQDCDPATLGPDSDGDGSPATTCCNPQPSGPPLCGTDCDDTRATINVTAIEACNGVDDNCDGRIDEGVPMMTCFDDSDGDSYAPAGAASHMACACSSTQTTRAPVGSDVDCNDANATVHPTAVDICDGLDNDCNGMIDDGTGAAYYRDCDADTYGDMAHSVLGCTVPTSDPMCPLGGGTWVPRPFDCNDARADTHPGATELCDGIDNDCNGTIDDHIAASTVASDPANCGACGHACHHPSCVAAVCTDDYVQLTVGASRACGRLGSGVVRCWGDNRSSAGTFGALGVGSSALFESTPMDVTGVADAVDVSSYRDFTCAVRRAGAVWCWGDATGIGPTPAAFGSHTAATNVLSDYGGPFIIDSGMLGGLDVLAAGVSATRLVRTDYGVALSRSDGTAAYVDYTTSTAGGPYPIGIADAVTIAGSGLQYYAVRTDGTLATWGIAPFGAMSSPGTVMAFGSVTDATDMSPATYYEFGTSMTHVLVVRRDGTLVHEDGVTPSSLLGVADAVHVVGDEMQGCYLKRDGRVGCWGDNSRGQLGDGTTTTSTTPVIVSGS